MKITINPVLDLETLQWVSNDGVYEYEGPVARFDGADLTPPAPILPVPNSGGGNLIVPVPNTDDSGRVAPTLSPLPAAASGNQPATPAASPAPRTFGGDFKAGFKGAANPRMTVDPETGQMTRTNPPQGSGGILGQILFGAMSGAARGLAAQPGPNDKGKGGAMSAGARAAEKAQDDKEEKTQKLAEQQFENNQQILKSKDLHNQAVMTQIEATRRMAHEDVEEPLVLERLGVDLETSKNNRQISRQALADHQRQLGEDIDNRIGAEPVGRISLGHTPTYGAPQQPQQ